MTWDLAVVGSVHLDDITTPAGRRTGLLGGSAVYFALAASPLAQVHLCGAVGADGETVLRRALAGTTVVLDGLEVVPAATHRWRAVHDFERWVTASEESDAAADELWSGGLTTDALAAPVLFIGSLDPRQQLGALRTRVARHRERGLDGWRLIGSDSMAVHIGEDAQTVRAVASASDVLFLNRAELSVLTGTSQHRWREAATSLLGVDRLRCVVVKGGPLGAACVTADGFTERQPWPVEAVVDPTGAGDSLAGGFLAACAVAERDDTDFFVEALDCGLRRAALAISDFGTLAFRAEAAVPPPGS